MPKCLIIGPYCLVSPYLVSTYIAVRYSQVYHADTLFGGPSSVAAVLQFSPVWLVEVERPNRQCGVGLESRTWVLAVLLAGCGT